MMIAKAKQPFLRPKVGSFGLLGMDHDHDHVMNYPNDIITSNWFDYQGFGDLLGQKRSFDYQGFGELPGQKRSFDNQGFGELLGQKRKINNEISTCGSDDHHESVKKKRTQAVNNKDDMRELDIVCKMNNEMADVNHDQFQLGEKRKIHGRKKRRVVVKMLCEPCNVPKNKLVNPKGEDAYFICEEAQTIGVADGVGRYATIGIDAGVYARGLMTGGEEKAAMDHVTRGATVNPRDVLNEAFARNIGVQGSSTACILTLDKETGVLHMVNVGDSGFMLFRDNKLHHKSETQQRRFNCPYQLKNTTNRLESALEEKIETIPGDVIVLATDGVFDNLFPKEIEEILTRHSTSCEEEGYDLDSKILALYIATAAYCNSIDPEYVSPFSEEAQKAGVEFTGGKKDDITVIVAHVVPAS